jgi:hypothetical protein
MSFEAQEYLVRGSRDESVEVSIGHAETEQTKNIVVVAEIEPGRDFVVQLDGEA